MPRRRLGQHFLTDDAVVARIVAAAAIKRGEPVVEIGPGHGALTDSLARQAERLILLELDPKMASSLERRYAAVDAVSVLEADARYVEIGDIPGLDGRPYAVVGNLPYYAASPIIRNFTEAGNPPDRMVAMVQREVALKMCGRAGQKSLLSVAVQLYADVAMLFDVAPGSFLPPPKVTSTVIEIHPLGKARVSLESVEGFFDIVKAGFSRPRKQLHNSMATGLGVPSASLAPLFERANIDSARRPATLSIEEWAGLYRAGRGTRLGDTEIL
jgi:16S rRNA (adenine1518-N6/adenine1519-N6)-dimethyltransferase